MMLNNCSIVLLSVQLLLLATRNYVIAETIDTFLQGFYARSLFKTESSLNVFEIEETYDNLRGLGKLVVHSTRFGHTVLHSQLNGPLHLDVQYDLNGTVTGCSASQNERIGGFHLFNHMQELWPSMKEQSHLIGPASLLYLFRQQLLDYQQDVSESTQNSTSLHRLILDPRPIEIDSHATFKRSAFMVNTSPLLRQLAAYLEFESHNQKYFVDFLDIKQFDATRDGSTDTFKMPSVLLCTDETISSLLETPDFLTVNAIGSSVNLRHKWQDLPRKSPQQHRLVLDSRRDLFQFEVEHQWSNVVDLKGSLLFHKSAEQSPVVQHKTDVLATDQRQSQQVRNSDCSILTSPELDGYKSLLLAADSISARQLAFYTGNFKRNVYLGVESNHRGRGRAHVFELSFATWQDLPVPVRLLEPPLVNESVFPLIGNLLIAAVDTCRDLYTQSAKCDNPILLGFQLQYPDWKPIGSIEYNNFEWHSSESQISSLNLDTCPLEKLKLLLEIGSSSGLLLRAPELDRVVLDRMLAHLNALSVSGLHLISFQRTDTPPSSNKLAYSMELAEAPEVAVTFERNSKTTRKLDMNQIDALSDVYTSQECFAWASQFGQSRNVLYSRVEADCVVYSLEVSQILDGPGYSAGSYEVFSRKLQPLPKSDTPIKLFLNQQLEAINARMKADNKGSKMSIRFLHLRPIEEVSASNGSAGTGTTLLAEKSKFAKRRSDSVLSFRDCSFRCQDRPDCGSFSYCVYENLEQFCQLSNETSLADANLTTDYNCEIHAKNYLHYFHQPPEPPQLDHNANHLRWRLLRDQSFKENPQECARVCHSDDSCVMFLHCASEGCLVWDETQGSSSMVSDPTQCDSYTRRPSSLFVATRFRELGAFSWTGPQLQLVQMSHHQNVEECTERCITVSECVSFDVCHVAAHPSVAKDTKTDPVLPHLECTLLSGSIYHEPPMVDTPSSVEQLNHSATGEVLEIFRCRHFERVGASLGLNPKGLLHRDQPPEPTRFEQPSFYLINVVLALCLGILAGLTLPNLNHYFNTTR